MGREGSVTGVKFLDLIKFRNALSTARYIEPLTPLSLHKTTTLSLILCMLKPITLNPGNKLYMDSLTVSIYVDTMECTIKGMDIMREKITIYPSRLSSPRAISLRIVKVMEM